MWRESVNFSIVLSQTLFTSHTYDLECESGVEMLLFNCIFVEFCNLDQLNNKLDLSFVICKPFGSYLVVTQKVAVVLLMMCEIMVLGCLPGVSFRNLSSSACLLGLYTLLNT